MWLRKEHGGSGVGQYWWPHDGSVVEVPEEQLAAALLGIPDGGYTVADGPDPEPKPAAKAPAAKAAPPAAAAAKTAAGKDAG